MGQKRKGGVSKSLKKHAQILCLLAKVKPKVIKALIAASDNSLIQTISSCSSDILNGIYSLTPSQKNRLKRYRCSLRKLTEKRVSTSTKRALLMKGGSLLPVLIGTIAPLLIKSILPRLFKSASPKTKKN